MNKVRAFLVVLGATLIAGVMVGGPEPAKEN